MGSDKADHACVLYGYKDGKLQIYDPNYPGETVQWPWSPTTGFSAHPKASGNATNFYDGIKFVGAAPVSKFKAEETLALVRLQASLGLDGSSKRYPRIDATTTDAGVGEVAVTGQISTDGIKDSNGDGVRMPESVSVAINGATAGSGKVRADGSFSVLVSSFLLNADGPNSVRVTAISDLGTFAGSKEQALASKSDGAPGKDQATSSRTLAAPEEGFFAPIDKVAKASAGAPK